MTLIVAIKLNIISVVYICKQIAQLKSKVYLMTNNNEENIENVLSTFMIRLISTLSIYITTLLFFDIG